MFAKKLPVRNSTEAIEPPVHRERSNNDGSNENVIADSGDHTSSTTQNGPYDLDDYDTIIIEHYDPDASFISTFEPHESGDATSNINYGQRQVHPLPKKSNQPDSPSDLISSTQTHTESISTSSTTIKEDSKPNNVKKDPPETIHSTQVASYAFARSQSSGDDSQGSNDNNGTQHYSDWTDTKASLKSEINDDTDPKQSIDAAEVIVGIDISDDSKARMKTDSQKNPPDAPGTARYQRYARTPITLPNGEVINSKNINRSYVVASHSNEDARNRVLPGASASPSLISAVTDSVQAVTYRNIDVDSGEAVAFNTSHRSDEVVNVCAEPVYSVLLVEAEPAPPPLPVPKQKSVTYRVLVALVVGVVGAAIFVSGYCGSGNCSSNPDDTDSRPTVAPIASTNTPNVVPAVFISAAEITAYINEITWSNRSIKANGTTPEDKALKWVIGNTNVVSLEDDSERLRLRQQYCLGILYAQQEVNSQYWYIRTGWLEDKNECNWYGLTCNTTDVGDEVTRIDFSGNETGNNIYGTIPADLGLLTSLEKVDLSLNFISGSLPSSIGNWVSLTSFNVASNYLNGTIPDSIGNWTVLRNFDISYNSLNGTIPNSIGQWTTLKSLVLLGGSEFRSGLPDSIGTWTALNSFTLSIESVDGTLPESIGKWTALTSLSISGAILRKLPESIGQWTELKSLDLSVYEGYALSGPLPDTIGHWTELTYVSVYQSLPVTVGNWTALKSCSLSVDSLSGTFPAALPDSIGQWTALTSFDLSAFSDISGTIPLPLPLPDTIGNWSALQSCSLLLSQLGLNETLPESVGHWTALTSFSLSGSSLTRIFPESIGNWTALKSVELDTNYGSSGIPLSQGISFPESVGGWTSLTSFTFRGLLQKASFPESFGRWTALESFTYGYGDGGEYEDEFASLNSTLWTTLPALIGEWTALTSFVVSNGALIGTLPVSMVNWTNLSHFVVSFNALTGTLPELIGQWTNLTYFSVWNNTFTGTLPESIGSWTSLTGVDVSYNSLNGTIPNSILNWTRLETAYFEGNNFTGTMPNGLCDAPGLDSLYVDCAEVACCCCSVCALNDTCN
jgi:Leucine-rich repeat (LRR) protein